MLLFWYPFPTNFLPPGWSFFIYDTPLKISFFNLIPAWTWIKRSMICYPLNWINLSEWHSHLKSREHVSIWFYLTACHSSTQPNSLMESTELRVFIRSRVQSLRHQGVCEYQNRDCEVLDFSLFPERLRLKIYIQIDTYQIRSKQLEILRSSFLLNLFVGACGYKLSEHFNFLIKF